MCITLIGVIGASLSEPYTGGGRCERRVYGWWTIKNLQASRVRTVNGNFTVRNRNVHFITRGNMVSNVDRDWWTEGGLEEEENVTNLEKRKKLMKKDTKGLCIKYPESWRLLLLRLAPLDALASKYNVLWGRPELATMSTGYYPARMRKG